MNKKDCKHISGYYEYVRVSGLAVSYYDENGEFEETSVDMTNWKPLKTKYCSDCSKRMKLASEHK